QTQLEFIIQGTDKNIVYWIEHRGEARRGRTGQTHIILQATPIDISQILKQSLFVDMDTVVLTSATLAVAAGLQGGNFDYIRQRLGLDHTRELVVPSHFDYAKQAILYVPPDLPAPTEEAFVSKAAEKIRRLLAITQGRAFCLFTSHSQMRQIHGLLDDQLEFPMLLQGDAPKNALLEKL